MKETTPVPERISPENIEKKIYEQKRSKISLRKRMISAAAALAIVCGGTAGYLYGTGFFDKKNGGIQTSSSSSSSKADSSSNNDDSQTGTIKTSDAGVEYEDSKSVELTGLKSMNYDELNEYIKENFKDRSYYFRDNFGGLETDDAVAEDEAVPETTKGKSSDAAVAGSNGSRDYSQTYNQEAGIDEADIVKTNGEDIFYLAGSCVFAIDCDNGSMKGQLIDFTKLCSEDFGGYTAREMYLDGGTLTVVLQSTAGYYYSWHYDEDEENKSREMRPIYEPTCYAVDLDVSNIDDIKITGKYSIQGTYSNSRMVDGKLYLTVTQNVQYCESDSYEKTGVPEFAPVYKVNGEKHYVSSGDIFVPTEDVKENLGYTTVSLIDTKDMCHPVSIKSSLGYTNEIYQSADRLVLLGSYSGDADGTWKNFTRLTMFDTSNGALAPMASTSIEGEVKDKYSLSYRDSVLSVVVNDRKYDNVNYKTIYNNYLYTFSDKLEQLGQSENFGDGEVIKSVTFQDKLAYIVTFMQTDPLFAIDVSDPAKPTIIGELKMPGFSTHMRAFTEGRLVGFGNTANEDTGRVTGLKLSIYDNSDPNNVKELDKVELKNMFGDDVDSYVGSIATYDEKALLLDAERNILAFPYYAETQTYSTYSTFIDEDGYEYAVDTGEDAAEDTARAERVKQDSDIYMAGYKFYRYTEGKGFELVGEYKYEVDVTKFWNDRANEGKNPYIDFERAIYIGDVYYLFHDNGVVSVNSKTFETIDEADLVSLIPEGQESYKYYYGGLVEDDYVV